MTLTDHHQADRRKAIVRLLASGGVRKQQDLVRLLQKEGFVATQSSISRDMRDRTARLDVRGDQLHLVIGQVAEPREDHHERQVPASQEVVTRRGKPRARSRRCGVCWRSSDHSSRQGVQHVPFDLCSRRRDSRLRPSLRSTRRQSAGAK